ASLTRSISPRSSRASRISPSTMRPGGTTSRRIDCAVTLLPHPLSPTMPSVFLATTSNDAPSTAFVVPSSWKKLVRRFLTDGSALVSFSPIDLDGDSPSFDDLIGTQEHRWRDRQADG